MSEKKVSVLLALRDQFTGPMKEAQKSTRKLYTETRKAQKEIDKSRAALFNYGKVGALALGTMAVASTKMAMDFSKSMAKISTISGNENLVEMKRQILALSDTTGVAADAIAQDVYDAISSGVAASKAVAYTANSTKLAKAGFAESGEALDLLTTITNSYGMKAEEVTNISDILINTQNKGKVTVGELSTSMGKVIPTANAMRVGLEQVASGYAIMTSKGIKSAEATTYINAMLNEMGKTGTKTDKVLRKGTGKSFQQLTKEGKSVGDILAILNAEATKNKLTLSDLFGSSEAAKAGLILVNDSGKEFNKTLKDMQNSSGATQEALDKIDQEPAVKMEKALNSIKNTGIEIGGTFLPIVAQIGTDLNNFAKNDQAKKHFSAIFTETKNLYDFIINNFGTIAPIFLTVGAAVGVYKLAMLGSAAATKLSNNAALAYDAILVGKTAKLGLASAATVFYTSVLGGQNVITAIGTTAQWAFNAALSANPIGLVIGALAALGLAIYAVVKNWKSICEWIGKAWDWLTKWNGTKAKDKDVKVTTTNKEVNDIQTNHSSNSKGDKDEKKPRTGKNAMGTSNWRGGLTSINELGGEIIDLPKGSRVYPHDKSIEMARSEGKKFVFNINIGNLIGEDSLVERVGKKIAKEIQMQLANI